MNNEQDRKYLDILVQYIRVCAQYKPKLGHGAKAGYSLQEFQALYRADPFYSWLGLDNPLLYAAHKAAGGMTSVYRQIGMGCEVLFRQVLRNALGLSEQDVKWSYTLPKLAGKTRTLHLDARIPVEKVNDAARRKTIQQWIRLAAHDMEIEPRIAKSLSGIVFELRQGYKSKDSKRQNADIANAATAYTKGLLPCAGILSLQIDQDIALRYRSERWVLLTGIVGESSTHESIYAFAKEIVGYDLASFFQRNSGALKDEINKVLIALLKAEGT
ncbi:MAG: hypothetical protein Q8Q12_07950 [bacterium]|nr:hypothetical protein [bacterium]